MKKYLLLLLTFWTISVHAQVQFGGVTNVTKIGGTAVDVNSGNKSAGTQRVVLATDQPNVPTTTNGTIFTFSTVNSSVAQLAASATFTGTVESVVNQQSYSLLFFSDQNATITIKQYIDAAGLKLISSLSYTYTASGQFARSGVMNGNYCNVVVQNTGGSTTTTLQLDMAYGTIPAATQLNNSPSAINEINGTVVDQNSGNKSAGSQRVVIATDDINLAAINTATAAINTKTVQGTGAASTAQLVTLSNENIQDLYFTGQAAQTALVNNIIPSTVSSSATDLTGYNSAMVQIICPAGTYTTGAIIFEGSNDNTNFQTIPVYNQLILTGTPITAAITLVTTTSIGYTFPIKFRYIRVRISTAVSGASASVQAISTFKQAAWTPAVFQVAQATGANLNAAISALPTLAAVTTVSTVTTLANGQTAHSSASTGSPLRISGRVAPTTIATVDQTLAFGDASDVGITTGQQLITKSNATSELDYNFFLSSAVTTVTVQTLVQASGTAGVRNYLKSLRVSTDAIGASGSVWLLDGALTVSSIAITTGLTTTSAAHDLKIGDAVVFTALAAGTGVSTNTVYYVTSVGSTTTFNFALTPGGANVVPSVAYTGTTMYRILDQIRVQTSALSPTMITYDEPIRSNPNMALNFLIPSSLTSGNIYLTVNGYRLF